jgi:hypothetical protein
MTRSRTNADQARTESLNVVPHIIPDVLHPAIAGKLLDGSTAHGSIYGVAQADGRMYYYTDIKGSKPIKDPRIGAHFGSQRHTTRSLQLLEQETATHGENVHSVDGRNWMRTVNGTSSTAWIVENSLNGNSIMIKEYAHGSFIEITGYFNDINFVVETGSTRGDDCDVYVNGGSATANDTLGGETTVASPLLSRFVSSGSVINVGTTVSNLLGTTPAINTIKFVATGVSGSEEINFHGIELIVQDTTSTATKSQIQIPSQNVVSYGKKFTVGGSSAHTHYDPFNGFTNGTTLHSAVVDTATSLGLSTGTLHGATWAISGSNNIRPYNGGRVVKWVDSSGVIKTSVNMMPPNAQNTGTSAGGNGTVSAEITTPSATNVYLPAFSDDPIDHSLAEVAKTFHWREFGNGAANGGYSPTYADASMLPTTFDDIAYVMDDGLTSLTGDNIKDNGGVPDLQDSGSSAYWTFIGTGFSGRNDTIVQNLPYGTHVLKITIGGSVQAITCDGVLVHTGTESAFPNLMNALGQGDWISIFQPKMPPIPEDAVVISDYMLMADFVAQTADGVDKISKGVRYVSSSRDVFYDGAVAWTATAIHVDRRSGYTTEYPTSGGHADCVTKIPSFATQIVHCAYSVASRYQTFNVNGSGGTITNRYGSGHGGVEVSSASTLGNNIWSVEGTSQTAYIGDEGWQLATPIHTSSHYQTFETPLLHELVGGDRNMEQNNLVVTGDGKTWDDVTRDTSYIGSGSLSLSADHGEINVESVVIMDECRGFKTDGNAINHYNKDFAIAYDRQICLRDGQYQISQSSIYRDNALQIGGSVRVNGDKLFEHHCSYSNWNTGGQTATVELKRGDYVQVFGGAWSENDPYSAYSIERLN